MPKNQAKKPALHIIVVDDEPAVLDSMRVLLAHLGHTIQTADNGVDALALLGSGHFNLVITDYYMQGMKGDELAKVIRLRLPELPIIMATAFADELKADGRLEGNVDCLLIKPFSLTELTVAIASVMR
jgi:CheY-like chemotaxis protein